MPFFRKKPVRIEAQQVQEETIEQVAVWCHGSIRGIRLPKREWVISIETLEGEMRAEVGDWVICGVKGEFYPCKSEIFTMTYEEVE